MATILSAQARCIWIGSSVTELSEISDVTVEFFESVNFSFPAAQHTAETRSLYAVLSRIFFLVNAGGAITYGDFLPSRNNFVYPEEYSAAAVIAVQQMWTNLLVAASTVPQTRFALRERVTGVYAIDVMSIRTPVPSSW